MREHMWVLYLAGGGLLIFGLLLLIGVSDWWRNRRQENGNGRPDSGASTT